MEKVIELSFKLHDLLLNSSEYQILKEKEQIMLNDKTSSTLIKSYQELQAKYLNDKTSILMEKIKDAKLAMEANELVKEYKLAYKNYQILIGEITQIVFKDFSNDSLIEQIIKSKR